MGRTQERGAGGDGVLDATLSWGKLLAGGHAGEERSPVRRQPSRRVQTMRNGSSSVSTPVSRSVFTRVSTNARKVGGEIDGRALPSSADHGGRTIVRAADRAGAEGLRRMFARCSAETLRLRVHISLLTVSEQVVGLLLGAWPRPWWRGRVLVALSEGEIVGHAMCVAEQPGDDEAEVAVVVEDAWRGKGIARALLANLLEEAAELGIRSFHCETLPENRAAADLARGLPGGEVRCLVWGTRHTARGRRAGRAAKGQSGPQAPRAAT